MSYTNNQKTISLVLRLLEHTVRESGTIFRHQKKIYVNNNTIHMNPTGYN